MQVDVGDGAEERQHRWGGRRQRRHNAGGERGERHAVEDGTPDTCRQEQWREEDRRLHKLQVDEDGVDDGSVDED